MSEVFGFIYADAYDMLYHDKDYAAERDLIVRIFQTYGDGPIRSVLDLGCGTGNHAIPLAQRGYQVTGIDRSPEMLRIARQKADVAGVSVSFHRGDIRTVDLGQQFDACICMFAVLCYQLSNTDVEAALRTVRKHLREGGLFVFDFWYGPAVLAIRPEQRIRIIEKDDARLIRLAIPHLDTRTHTNETEYLLLFTKDDSILVETG